MSIIFEAYKKLADQLNEHGFKTVYIDEKKHPIAFSQGPDSVFIDCPQERYDEFLQVLTSLGYTDRDGAPLGPDYNDWAGYMKIKPPNLPIGLEDIVITQATRPEHVGADIDSAITEGWGAELFEAWKDIGILNNLFPDLAACINAPGGDEHNEDVYTHLITALRFAPTRILRYAALFHDIGKPQVYKVDKDGKTSFHRHELASYKIFQKFCKDYDIYLDREIGSLVLNHMFYFEERASDKAIRHWLAKVGPEVWPLLFELREIDRRANFAKIGKPTLTSEMKKLKARIKKIIEKGPAIFRRDLEISKDEVFDLADLNYLTETALEEIFSNLLGLVQKDPNKNNPEYLREYVSKVYGTKLGND